MSGSGGGGYIPPQNIKFDCKTSFTVTVSSIDLDVLTKHTIKDELDVILTQNELLVLEDGNGEILGSIVHINTTKLIECIRGGAEYKAVIIRIIAGFTCTVEIIRK